MPPTATAHLRGIAIVYAALMLGMVIFAGIVLFLVSGREPPVPGEEGSGLETILPIAAGFLTLTTVLPAVLLGRQLTARMAGAAGLGPAERAQRYIGAKILLGALVEGPGLLWGIIALLTGNLLHLFGLAFSVFGLALLFPKGDEWRDITGLDEDASVEIPG